MSVRLWFGLRTNAFEAPSASSESLSTHRSCKLRTSTESWPLARSPHRRVGKRNAPISLLTTLVLILQQKLRHGPGGRAGRVFGIPDGSHFSSHTPCRRLSALPQCGGRAPRRSGLRCTLAAGSPTYRRLRLCSRLNTNAQQVLSMVKKASSKVGLRVPVDNYGPG